MALSQSPDLERNTSPWSTQPSAGCAASKAALVITPMTLLFRPKREAE